MRIVAGVVLACVVLAALSLLGGLGGVVELRLGGVPAQTATQKGLFLVVGLAMAACGAAFWWQARRGSTVGALLCWAALVAIFGAIASAYGSADVISVGGA